MEKRWKVGIISDAAGFSQAGSIFIDEPPDDLEEVKKNLVSHLPAGYVGVVIDDQKTGQRHPFGEPGSFQKWLDLMG